MLFLSSWWSGTHRYLLSIRSFLGQQVEEPEKGLPSISQRSEESAPPTSGLCSSAKRSRDESYREQVSANRHRWNCEDSHEESATSTSGFSFFTYRMREDTWSQHPQLHASGGGLIKVSCNSSVQDYKYCISLPTRCGKLRLYIQDFHEDREDVFTPEQMRRNDYYRTSWRDVPFLSVS